MIDKLKALGVAVLAAVDAHPRIVAGIVIALIVLHIVV